MTAPIMVAKGLEDVVVAQTRLSYVYGNEGRLIYRGYDIFDLAAHSTFEETAYLMLYGNLPSTEELASFKLRLAQNRKLPDGVIDRVLKCLPPTAHPMDALRSVVSTLGIFDPQASEMSTQANLNKATRLVAKLPTIVAAFDRIRRGQEPVEPDPSLGHAANFLYMVQGVRPDDWTAKVFDICLILHIDHGFNASTFAARVSASTLADIHGAVTSAIAALKGPLHGGANERVMEMLEEIGEVDKAEDYVRTKLKGGARIMGFGHRVYRTEDPRATVLRKLAYAISERNGDLRWVEMQKQVEDVMLSQKEALPQCGLLLCDRLQGT